MKNPTLPADQRMLKGSIVKRALDRYDVDYAEFLDTYSEVRYESGQRAKTKTQQEMFPVDAAEVE